MVVLYRMQSGTDLVVVDQNPNQAFVGRYVEFVELYSVILASSGRGINVFVEFWKGQVALVF